ncbi:MAG TPA: U32 family peptidase [Clostridia bacterium]|nr:U32 family peptidase [Clostridia bacterium]
MELLAPAGNRERLKTAFRFGADAAYLGLRSMSLRNFADNFTLEELYEACAFAHMLHKRVFVTVNAFVTDGDLKELPALLRGVSDAGADALIVNDPGVTRTAQKFVPQMPLHLSTQANTLNAEAALFWHELGVKRIVLARELSFSQIGEMRKKLPETLELEMFVHGAMCVSYSGRCLLSNYIARRDSNRGECAQPCRWTYELRERGKDGAYFGVEQDERGTYVLNAKDLNLIRYIDKIAETGVDSIKIEGRMKSIGYVATVVNAYRMALDAYDRGEALDERVTMELERASHRPYFTGFALGDPGTMGQETQTGGYMADATICAVVHSFDAQKKLAHIEQRNRFFDGETLSILSPGDPFRTFTVNGIWDADGSELSAAPHPKQKLAIGCDAPLKEGDILRRT